MGHWCPQAGASVGDSSPPAHDLTKHCVSPPALVQRVLLTCVLIIATPCQPLLVGTENNQVLLASG